MNKKQRKAVDRYINAPDEVEKPIYHQQDEEDDLKGGFCISTILVGLFAAFLIFFGNGEPLGWTFVGAMLALWVLLGCLFSLFRNMDRELHPRDYPDKPIK